MRDNTPRWLDGDLPHELQRVLASAAEDGGDAGQIMRLQAKLEAKLGPALSRPERLSEPADLPGAATAGQRVIVAAKSLGLPGAIAAGALAAMIGLGALHFGTVMPKPELAQARQPLHAASQPAPSRVSAATSAAPVPTAPPARALVEAPRMSAPAATEVAAAQPRRGLGEELRQLEAIRLQLARNPARALAAADRHARRFPEGTLGPERDLLRVEALLLLAQRERAQALADRIIRTPGGSPYAAQLRLLLSER